MSNDETLTPRQREIKERLDKKMTAREIGDELGISRNAVYQQIQALRRKGALDRMFTPSGQYPREQSMTTLFSRVAGDAEPSGSVLAHMLELAAAYTNEIERLTAQFKREIGAG